MDLRIISVLLILLALAGYYAKVATERAALAEAALDTLAKGYEQYEKRIADANKAQRRRDAEWKRMEEGYEKQIRDFESRPVDQCDAAAVDSSITDSLLSRAGYDKARSGDTANSSPEGGTSSAAPYLSNRGQSKWLAGYQRQLDKCNTQLIEIKKLVKTSE